MKYKDPFDTSPLQTPIQVYLSELKAKNHPKAIAVVKIVANYQGFTDWHMAQWQRITVDDLPAILEQLRGKFTDQDDINFAAVVIKGVARCTWRQKLMPSPQLAAIGKWKGWQ